MRMPAADQPQVFLASQASAPAGCRHGSGLEGQQLAESFTQLLTCLVGSLAGQGPALDWLWTLYCTHLADWAQLAGPVSDGLVLRCLQECWAGAPWQHAGFHLQDPGAAGLSSCDMAAGPVQ